MAILQTAPVTMKVVFNGHWSNGEKMTTTMHFIYSSGDVVTSDEAESIASDAQDVWQSEMLDIIADNYQYDGVTWLDMHSITGVTGSKAKNTSLPVAGTGAGETLPPSVSGLVKKSITASGRGKKPGRMYLPPPAEIDVDENGMFLTGAVTIYDAKLEAVLTAWNGIVKPGGDYIIAAVPHYLGADKPEDIEGEQVVWAAQSVSHVTSLTLDPKVGTQRRRLR